MPVSTPKPPHSRNRRDADNELPANDWLSSVARLNIHYGRFLRDALGVVLIALALMSLLAFWGITRGALLTPLVQLLSTWFGWGGYLLVLGMGYGGISLLRRDAEN